MSARHAPPVRLERSHGVADVGLTPGPDGGRLDRLLQSGSGKAFLHKGSAGGSAYGVAGPEIAFLNTSGGLTGGDTLCYRLDLGVGCRATATTQTAERVYRSAAEAARVTVHHKVGAGGHLDWLPQETILFDHSNLLRETTIELAADASCLMLETIVLGRAAMGETVLTTHLRDTRRILRAGKPVLVEPLHLISEALNAGLAVLNGARAFATLALVGQGASDALGRVRAEMDQAGVTGGASAFDGKLIVRLMAVDGWPLRRQIMRLLAVLRAGPVPRVWQV